MYEMTQTLTRQCSVCLETVWDGFGAVLTERLRNAGLSESITAENALSVGMCPCCHQYLPGHYQDGRRARGLISRWNKLRRQ